MSSSPIKPDRLLRCRFGIFNIDIIQDFVLPIVTAVVAGVLLFVVQRYFVAWGRVRFSGYPNVEGRYRAVYEEQAYPDNQVVLEQKGARVTGTIAAPHVPVPFRLTGTVTPTRLLSYRFEPTDSSVHNFGSALLKLNRDGTEARGYLLYLTPDQEQPQSVGITFTKLF